MTDEILLKLIAAHRSDAEEIRRLYNVYKGDVTVDKGDVAEGRPDNQAYTNLAHYITNTATGNFVGAPPTYMFDRSAKALEQALTEVFDQNDETTINYTIAEDMSIAGAGFDLVWADEEARARISALDPMETFLIESSTVEPKPLYGVRHYLVTIDGQDAEVGELYAPDAIKVFRIDGDKLVYTEQRLNPFGDVPVTRYDNNRFMMGDFEPVLKNIEQYNIVLSNTTDDLQSIANAFLCIEDAGGTEQEDIDAANKSRVILIPNGGKAYFVTKALNAEAVKDQRGTLKEDILQVAGVPDLSDESFSGNTSGVALNYKFWGLAQLFAKKKAGMEAGLFNRIKLLTKFMNVKGMGSDEKEVANMISIKFTQNMPKDVSADIESAAMLNGIVSNQTVHEMLEPVTGVTAQDEAQRMEQEEIANPEYESIQEARIEPSAEPFEDVEDAE